MSYFKYNDKNIYYTIEGQGKPIVILNGIMMSTKSWEPFVKSFSQDNMLIRFDFFDQGQSDKLENTSYTHEIQVDLLKALVDHLQLEKVNIVGISYGGEIALEFSIKYSNNVDRIVLFNTTANTNPWLRDIGRGWIAAGKTRNGESYYNTAIPIIYSPHFYQTKIDWMEKRKVFLSEGPFANKDFLDAMERLTLSSETYDIREKLHLITANILIVSAEEDYLTPLAEQEFLYKNIKSADWIKIPYAGHASMYEKPLLFTTLVLGFINTLDTEYKI